MKIGIVSNKETEHLGYFYNSEAVRHLVESLERTGVDSEVFYANDVSSLERFLMKNFDLIFPNIYTFSNNNSGDEVWLTDILTEKQIPYVGHDKEGLSRVLDKARCHDILEQNGVLVPGHVILNNSEGLDNVILNGELTYPVMVKPNSSCASIGIDESSKVYNREDVVRKANELFVELNQDVVVEEYLPGTEMTAGIIKAGERKFVTTALYPNNMIRGYDVKTTHGGIDGGSFPIYDDDLNKMLESIAEQVHTALGLRDLTRFDCRFDGDGNIRVFDVNGMPGMHKNDSLVPKITQFRSSDMNRDRVYDLLINTFVVSACQRYNISVPDRVMNENLFVLNKQQFEYV